MSAEYFHGSEIKALSDADTSTQLGRRMIGTKKPQQSGLLSENGGTDGIWTRDPRRDRPVF